MIQHAAMYCSRVGFSWNSGYAGLVNGYVYMHAPNGYKVVPVGSKCSCYIKPSQSMHVFLMPTCIAFPEQSQSSCATPETWLHIMPYIGSKAKCYKKLTMIKKHRRENASIFTHGQPGAETLGLFKNGQSSWMCSKLRTYHRNMQLRQFMHEHKCEAGKFLQGLECIRGNRGLPCFCTLLCASHSPLCTVNCLYT